MVSSAPLPAPLPSLSPPLFPMSPAHLSASALPIPRPLPHVASTPERLFPPSPPLSPMLPAHLSASMSELLLYATSAARCQYSIALMVQCFSATSYPAHAWFQWYAIVVRLPTFSSDSDRSSSSASCACMRRRWKCGMTSYTMSRSTMLNSQMPASRSVGLSQPACCSSTR
eukprot:352775-Chlamydomonas_euryale.AAC.4